MVTVAVPTSVLSLYMTSYSLDGMTVSPSMRVNSGSIACPVYVYSDLSLLNVGLSIFFGSIVNVTSFVPEKFPIPVKVIVAVPALVLSA